ncbi:MAG: CRISPR system precrRNA processing endoribonuclease RAMP protein Cas6 [Desulfobacterales bacterium]
MDKDTFWIEHYSPTSFKCGDSHLPLPVPERIIKSVFRQLPENLIKNIISNLDELAEVLQLKQHQITSVYNRKNHGSIASFTGKTRWQISKKADRRQKQDIWKLLHFAFYSGIGVKTTQGMGMCRVHYQGDE